MSTLDPGQREYELAEAIMTLIVAASRYAGGNKRPRPTSARLYTMAEITALLADGTAERIGKIKGKAAAKKFRKRIGFHGHLPSQPSRRRSKTMSRNPHGAGGRLRSTPASPQ
jgi:hypothetical protein